MTKRDDTGKLKVTKENLLVRGIDEGYTSAQSCSLQTKVQQLDPPKPPRTFSKDFIWEAILNSLERGSLNAILFARDFAKANRFPVSEIKKYEDEFKSWNLERYL